MRTRRIDRQRGWVGLVVILLALAIVAVLVRDALKQYGMLGASGKATAPAGPTGLQQQPPPASALDANSGARPSFQTQMERARGVESTLTRGAESQGKGIDDATR
jgi:hypothetical protein